MERSFFKLRDSQDASVSDLEHSKTFFTQFMTWVYDENRYVPKNYILNQEYEQCLCCMALGMLTWLDQGPALLQTVHVNVLRDEKENLKKKVFNNTNLEF